VESAAFQELLLRQVSQQVAAQQQRLLKRCQGEFEVVNRGPLSPDADFDETLSFEELCISTDPEDDDPAAGAAAAGAGAAGAGKGVPVATGGPGGREPAQGRDAGAGAGAEQDTSPVLALLVAGQFEVATSFPRSVGTKGGGPPRGHLGGVVAMLWVLFNTQDQELKRQALAQLAGGWWL